MAINPAMMPQIAALLAQRQQQPQGQEKKTAYYGTIPNIAEARAGDPMQKLANTSMANGSSTAPVAGGGWAWADGIARALQGGLGAIGNNKLDKQYGEREQRYMQGLQEAAQGASNPATANPATVNPGVVAEQQVAQALLAPGQQGQGAGVQSFDPGPSSAAQQPPLGQPQGLMPGQPGAMPTGDPAAALRGFKTPFPQTPASSRRGTQTPREPADLDAMFMNGIVRQEAVQNKDGTYQTSWKGAVGPAQVMPGTARQVAASLNIPFDENKYKNDPEYNIMLGKEYFRQQLDRFGDPAKAAAAYNAGPGAVQRAVRRANKNGGEWVDYLPSTKKDGKVVDTTAEYVRRFNETIGQTDYQSSTTKDQIAAVGPTQVAAPEYEDVPDVDRSSYVPPEVQSNRIAMAQQMLSSGNPDLAVMAQAYLDKGLDEQNSARMRQNDQQFTYGRDERGYAQQDMSAAQDRNFGRESTAVSQGFTANENAAEREQRTREANQGVSFQSRENEAQREFAREERIADQKFRGEQAKIEREAAGNPYWDSVGGMKLRDDMRTKLGQTDVSIDRMERALNLLENNDTGGIYALPFMGDVFASLEAGNDAELGELMAAFNAATLENIGGSLGVGISNADVDLIRRIGGTVGTDVRSNTNLMQFGVAAAKRKREYIRQQMYAEGNQDRDFDRKWELYVKSTPMARVTKDGAYDKAYNPMSYEQWLDKLDTVGGN